VSRKVAAGGMGEVWEGTHATTGIRVAMKTLLPDAATNREMALRFRREAELLARVRSDRVARVVDFVVDPAHGPVLITEFIEGRSLAEVIESDRLSIEDAVRLGIDVAQAVRELHGARIVHRDLKPANVIVQSLGGGRTRAILVDLGVSRLVATCADGEDDLTALTKTEIIVGTFGYMAPEQILSARDVTEAADVYALGAILFRMVAGRPVFGQLSRVELLRTKLLSPAPRVRTGRADPVARGFERVVARALERDLRLRYPSMDAMLVDLTRLRLLVDRVRHRSLRVRRRVLAASAVAALFAAATATTAVATSLVRSSAPAAHFSPPRAGLLSSPAVVAKANATGSEAPLEPLACLPTDAPTPANPTRPVAPSPRVVPTRPKADSRSRDAYLLRAIQQAVAAEAYMTVTFSGAPEDEAPIASN
jgi:serine/threonine-protein kinase